MYTQCMLNIYIYISMHIALLRRAKQTHFDPQTNNIFFKMIALIVYWAWSSTEFDTQKTQMLSLCSTQAGRLRRQNSFWPVTFLGASPLWKVQINVRRKWRRFTQDRSLKITQDHLRGVAPSEVCRKVRFQCAFVILPKVGTGKAWKSNLLYTSCK